MISFAFNQPYTSQNRVELARLFDAYCREIFDSVPTNTPAEDAWVKTEVSGPVDDFRRMSRLIASTEWARHQLTKTFSDCLQKVALLRQVQSQKLLAAEAAQFASLALTFNADTDIDTFAKRANMKLELSMSSLLRQFLLIAATRTLDGRDDPNFQPAEKKRGPIK